jgi:hypothetical protein
MPKRVFEISSSGPDEFLQLIGGDPFGGSTGPGLRVPTLAIPQTRYLFNACAFSIAEGSRARILGYRQLVTIGQAGVPGIRFVEQEVISPVWRFEDGNVWMGLRRLGPPNANGIPFQTPVPYPPLDGTAFRWSMGSSLLFESLTSPDSYYTHLSAYTPPNRGRPWGTPLDSGNDWLSLQTQWRTHGAWNALDLAVEGPDTIGLAISVLQTDPSTRDAIQLPETFRPGGLSIEEQFLLNFPNAIYWRVGGSLIVEVE